MSEEISLETQFVPTLLNGITSCTGLIVGFTITVIVITISQFKDPHDTTPSHLLWCFCCSPLVLYLAVIPNWCITDIIQPLKLLYKGWFFPLLYNLIWSFFSSSSFIISKKNRRRRKNTLCCSRSEVINQKLIFLTFVNDKLIIVKQ